MPSLLQQKVWDESLGLGDPVPTLKWVLEDLHCIIVLQMQAWPALSLSLFLPCGWEGETPMAVVFI